MSVSSDLQWVINQYADSRRTIHYELANAYYAGEHRLAFATDRFRQVFGGLFADLADNICPSIIDVQTERLEITAFTSDRAKTSIQKVKNVSFASVKDSAADAAWNVWEENGMDIESDDVHRETLKTGNGYVLVWPGEDGRAEIWPQEPSDICVRYSKERKNVIDVAGKFWVDEENHLRITLYYPSETLKYRTKNELKGDNKLTPEDFRSLESIDNPYNRVPLFHFYTRKQYGYGASELKNVIPIQDALNKTIADMLIAMEFQSFRQRWVTGLEVDVNPVTGQPDNDPFGHGANRVITVSNENAKFGDFETVDINPFRDVANDFRAEAARVVGIPTHYLFLTGSSIAPSGESLKTSELRFTRKMARTQSRFGKTWEEVIKFALQINGDLPRTKAETTDFNAVWLPPHSRTDNENMDVLIKKQSMGVPPSQLQTEMGYDPDQIAQFAEERAANQPVIPKPNPNNLTGNQPSDNQRPNDGTDNLNTNG